MAHTKPHLRLVSPENPHGHGGITGSTLFVMAATLGSTLLGFSREVVNAKYYGTAWEMDTFLAAATVPTILFGVFQGALVSALLPAFSEYINLGEEEDGWRLANTAINGIFVVLSICAVLGYIFAPLYVPIIAHGFPGPQMGVAIHMTRWLMPSIVAVSMAGVFTAVLNAYHRFRATALTGAAVNLVTIACVLMLNNHFGIFALVLGTSLGLIAQMLVQLPAVLLTGKYRLVIDLRHPGLRRIGETLGPIVAGSAAGQAALFFDRFFASTLTPGYISGMNYATKLVNFPQQIFAAAIATVIFPLLAAQFAQANRAAVGSSVTTGLRLVNFITIPSVCALVVLAHPIVQTLFERGTFRASATQLCAGLLPYAAIGLVALASNVVLTRCAFACKEISWTVAISVFSVVVNVLLCVTWLPTLGARGLLLANSVSQSLQAVLLLALVSRIVRGIAWKPLLWATGKILLSSAVMVAVLNWIGALNVHPAPTLLSRFWFLWGEISIGGLAFVAVARMLDVEELTLVWQLILQKFVRNVPIPPESREAPIA